jgi:predicted DCC family thiol-disulfide oxidoreductase YuxK
MPLPVSLPTLVVAWLDGQLTARGYLRNMPNVTVLYDADCGVCLWIMGKLLAWDWRFRLRPVALDAPEADALVGDLGEEERMGSWHIVLPDGRRDSAGRALAPLMRQLPGGRPFAALVERSPRLADRAYYALSERRSALGKLVTAGARRRAQARIARRASSAT